MKAINYLIITLFMISCASNSKGEDINEIQEEVKKIISENGIPGVGIIVTNKTSEIMLHVDGVRDINSNILIEDSDKFHLGSNTKSMTAMLVAKLVELKKISWDTTLGDVFKSIDIHSDYKQVTIKDLLRHQGGLTSSLLATHKDLFLNFVELQKGGKKFEQRTLLARTLLKEAPSFKPKSKSNYSNAGVSVAAHMLEILLKDEYENILSKYLFTELNMKNCGFGTPGSSDVINEPRGHYYSDNKLIGIPPGPLADNPDAISGAGKVHCSLNSWGIYIKEHLKGSKGESSFLSQDTFKTLHTPKVNEQFGLGIISMKSKLFNQNEVLFHNGSNTMNFAEMWISPKDNIGIGVVVNAGHAKAQETVRKIVELVTRKLLSLGN